MAIEWPLISIATLIAGFLLAWWLRGRQSRAEIAAGLAESEAARQRAEQAHEYAEQRQRELSQELEAYKQETSRLAREVSTLQSDLKSQEAGFNAERKSLNEKLELLQQAEKKLGEQFENIASRLFDSKSEQFRKASADQLQNLLKPFRNEVESLHRDVREASKERHTLGEQIRHIVSETSALTNALKGDSKSQGDWGEIVLERILENSGLRKGEEYEVQTSYATDDADGGSRLRPDVIIHLPEQREIVIDSKVSLTAYERYANSDDATERDAQLKAHVQSMRRHIDELAGKRYDHIKAIHTLDYTLMWVPIEPAYFAAMQEDPGLVQLAMQKRVIPVCATTLFAVLKTIERIWQYERQNNNVQAIIDRASNLYDKFVNFSEAMDQIGTNIDRAQKSYTDARKRLFDGSGNVVRQIEQLRDMGLTPKKRLSADWTSQAGDDTATQSLEADDKNPDSSNT